MSLKFRIAKRMANYFGKPVYIGRVMGPCERHGIHKGFSIKIEEHFSLTFWLHLPFITLKTGEAVKIEYASPYAWDLNMKQKE